MKANAGTTTVLSYVPVLLTPNVLDPSPRSPRRGNDRPSSRKAVKGGSGTDDGTPRRRANDRPVPAPGPSPRSLMKQSQSSPSLAAQAQAAAKRRLAGPGAQQRASSGGSRVNRPPEPPSPPPNFGTPALSSAAAYYLERAASLLKRYPGPPLSAPPQLLQRSEGTAAEPLPNASAFTASLAAATGYRGMASVPAYNPANDTVAHDEAARVRAAGLVRAHSALQRHRPAVRVPSAVAPRPPVPPFRPSSSAPREETTASGAGHGGVGRLLTPQPAVAGYSPAGLHPASSWSTEDDEVLRLLQTPRSGGGGGVGKEVRGGQGGSYWAFSARASQEGSGYGREDANQALVGDTSVQHASVGGGRRRAAALAAAAYDARLLLLRRGGIGATALQRAAALGGGGGEGGSDSGTNSEGEATTVPATGGATRRPHAPTAPTGGGQSPAPRGSHYGWGYGSGSGAASPAPGARATLYVPGGRSSHLSGAASPTAPDLTILGAGGGGKGRRGSESIAAGVTTSLSDVTPGADMYRLPGRAPAVLGPFLGLTIGNRLLMASPEPSPTRSSGARSVAPSPSPSSHATGRWHPRQHTGSGSEDGGSSSGDPEADAEGDYAPAHASPAPSRSLPVAVGGDTTAAEAAATTAAADGRRRSSAAVAAAASALGKNGVLSLGAPARSLGLGLGLGLGAMGGKRPYGGAIRSSLVASQLASLKLSSESAAAVRGDTVAVSMAGPVLFTAPHGLAVWRGGRRGERRRLHKRERWSTEVALRLALAMRPYLGCEASFVVWNRKVAKPGDPDNLDPNYLVAADLAESPWHAGLLLFRDTYGPAGPNLPPRALAQAAAAGLVDGLAKGSDATGAGGGWGGGASQPPGLLHVDVHGKMDRRHDRDLDVGLRPMEEDWGDAAAVGELRETLGLGLAEALRGLPQHKGMTFTVQMEPYLDAFWGPDTFMTMSHQSVRMGTPALQLEMPLSLRRLLMRDDALVDRVARAIYAAYLLVAAPGAAARHQRAVRRMLSQPNGRDESFIPQILEELDRMDRASFEKII